MESRPVDQIVCPSCHASLPAAAEVCPYCKTATRGQTAGRSGSVAARANATDGNAESRPPLLDRTPLLDRPWVILSLLFFVTAILGLPVLWNSRAFGAPAKIGLSIVVTLYTIALFYGVGLILQMAFHAIKDAMG